MQKKHQEAAEGIIRARVGRSFHVENALTAFFDLLRRGWGGVEGLGWALINATDDGCLGRAIEFVLVLRSDTLDEFKVCPKPVLH